MRKAEERCHIFLLFADVAAALANLQAGKLNMCPTNAANMVTCKSYYTTERTTNAGEE